VQRHPALSISEKEEESEKKKTKGGGKGEEADFAMRKEFASPITKGQTLKWQSKRDGKGLIKKSASGEKKKKFDELHRRYHSIAENVQDQGRASRHRKRVGGGIKKDAGWGKKKKKKKKSTSA